MINGFLSLDELKDKTQHQELHRKVFQFAQGKIDKKFTSVPTTDEVPIGYFAYYESGSTYRIYVNFFGTMRYFNLT